MDLIASEILALAHKRAVFHLNEFMDIGITFKNTQVENMAFYDVMRYVRSGAPELWTNDLIDQLHKELKRIVRRLTA